MSIHFVGFKDSAQFARVQAVFGPPDFIHRRWDVRAEQEAVEGDVVIFAAGSERDAPAKQSFDDSAFF